MPNVQSDQLTALMGTQMTYYVDGGSFRSDLNGTLMQWQLYVPTDNKLYTKMASNESVFWNDAAEANDEIISTEVHPGAATILGYKCDELVVKCKSGQQKYYFSSKLPMDPKLLTKHNYGNWGAIIAKTKAIPLKIVVENQMLTMTSEATKVLPGKPDAALMKLPADVSLAKMPQQ